MAMDSFNAFRKKYYAAVPHSLYVSFSWIIGGLAGDFYGPKISIIVFILLVMINFPVGELLRKRFFNSSASLAPDNKLPMLFTLLSVTVPASLPVVFFACLYDINFFYPALAVIVGAHYIPFYYGYRLRSFIIAGILIWAAGTMIGLYAREHFSLAAYVTGFIILMMALSNFRFMARNA